MERTAAVVPFLPTNAPLATASLLGLPSDVRRLLSNGANVDGDGRGVTCSIPGLNSTSIFKPVQAAAIQGNLEILGLLLDKNAHLEQSDLNIIARYNRLHGAAVLSTIMKARPSLAITDHVVASSAANLRTRAMLFYILDTPSRLTLTESQVMIIITPRYVFYEPWDVRLVDKVLSGAENSGCDSQWVLEAFLHESSCGSNIKVVLDRYKPSPEMSLKLMEWVTKNGRTGRVMRSVVLEYIRGVGVGVGVEFDSDPDELIRAASLDVDLIQIVLNQADRIVITADVIRSFTNIDSCLFGLLMDHTSCESEQEFIRTGQDVTKQHLRFCPIQPSKEVWESAARLDQAAIEYLQARARPNVTFARGVTTTGYLDHEYPLRSMPNKAIRMRTSNHPGAESAPQNLSNDVQHPPQGGHQLHP